MSMYPKRLPDVIEPSVAVLEPLVLEPKVADLSAKVEEMKHSIDSQRVGTRSDSLSKEFHDGKRFEAERDTAERRFVIVCSRDLSAEHEAIFKQHGKTLRWKKESFLNLPFEELDFDFLFIDARVKEARLTLGRQDLSNYHKVAFVYAIQKGLDDFLSEIDTVDISSIPEHAINGKDFRHQLLHQKLTAPSLMKSVFRYFMACLSK